MGKESAKRLFGDRQGAGVAALGELTVGDLVVSTGERVARVGGIELSLTRREFDILAALAARPGWVLSPERLAECSGSADYASPNAVNVHITHVRAKLAQAGAAGLIVTVRGTGWRLQRTEHPIRPLLSTEPFAGRDTELSRLDAALQGPSGALIVVTGEAGMGKTTLVERALASLAPGIEVIRAVCDGNGSGEYWPWRQVLGELERRSGTRLSELQDGHLLARLLAPGEPGSDLAGVDRTMAFDAAARFISVAAGERPRPLAVFIDDLHWADDASLKLLAFLLKRSATLPWHLVLACRDDAASTRPALVALIERAKSRRDGLSLTLRGLSEEAIAALVKRALGVEEPERLATELAGLTAGNALLVTTCLRELATHLPDRPSLDALPQPTIAAIVAETVAHLPEATVRALRLAAVAGYEFDPALVGAMDGTADPGSAFAPALDAELVVPAGGTRLRFRHALIRDALTVGLTPEERERSHLAVARALGRSRATGEDDVVHRLAFHFGQAGAPGRRAAVGYEIAAARISRDRFAFEDAIEHLSRARALVEGCGYAPEQARRVTSAILERTGSACAASGDTSRTRDFYERALACRPRQDFLARARLHTRLGAAYMPGRERARAEREFEAALAELEAVSARDRSWWRGWIEVRLEQAEAAALMDTPLGFDLRATLEEPVERYGTARQICKYYVALADVLAQASEWQVSDDALAAASSAVSHAKRSGNDYLLAYAEGLLGSSLTMAGRPTEAEPHLRTALGGSRLCGDRVGEAAALLHLAMCARISGDVYMTEAHAHELERAARGIPSMPEFRSTADAHLAWVALRRGDRLRARTLSARALETWRADPACSQCVWHMAWPALSCALAAGDTSRALELATLMLSPGQQRLATGVWEALRSAVRHGAERDLTAAAADLGRAESLAFEPGYV